MQWKDRVYGEVSIADPALLELIATPTFQRLRGVRQAGPSALAFAFKDVTRYEHSLGVHVLLGRLGANLQEQVAGLVHDISHTAFSHAVDFLVTSDEQDHHESLKPRMLDRPDIAAALAHLGFQPQDFYNDEIYPLLERPLPLLCADRLDYFLRDGLACRVITPREVDRILHHLAVVQSTIVFDSLAVAREAAALFAVMNRDWWASLTEAFIYNEFADALREGFRLGILKDHDLLTDDAEVLAKLDAASSPLITRKLASDSQLPPRAGRGLRSARHSQAAVAGSAGQERIRLPSDVGAFLIQMRFDDVPRVHRSGELPVEKGVPHIAWPSDQLPDRDARRKDDNRQRSPGIPSVRGSRFSARTRDLVRTWLLAGEIPEAGKSLWVAELRGIDNQADLGGLARSQLDCDARNTGRDRLDLAGVNPGVDEPAPGSIKCLDVGELMSQVSHTHSIRECLSCSDCNCGPSEFLNKRRSQPATASCSVSTDRQ